MQKETFKYLGIQIELSKEGGFQQHQKDYIKKLEEIQILAKNMKENLDDHNLSILRHGAGKLNWAAQGKRLELSFRVTELSTHFKSGNVGHLKLINKSLRDIQNAEVIVKYPKLQGELVIVKFCDAALHNIHDRVSSGGGYIIFLVDRELRLAPIF